MKILSVETSAKACSAAVYDGGFISYSIDLTPETHSASLFPQIDHVLKESGLKCGDIDLFAVSNGPGSFTGIRIGIAAVKGMSWACDKPCIGISSLEAAARSIDADGNICALIDARRGQYYNALFIRENGSLKRLCKDRIISGEELLSLTERDYILAGDGAPLFLSSVSEKSEVYKLPDKYLQTAKGVALSACAAEPDAYTSCFNIGAVYLRLSQAERLLLERMEKQI